MLTVTYIGDEPREVSMLPSGVPRRIEPDQRFEVPERFAESYACQPHFFEVEGYEWPAPVDLGDDDPEKLLDEDPPDPSPPADEPKRKAGKATGAPVTETDTPKGK